MKKLKNEKALTKKAIEVGENYAQKRGYTGFSETTSANEKVESIYRLLVKDRLIQPLPSQHENILSMKHKLAMWISHQLPEDHSLLK